MRRSLVLLLVLTLSCTTATPPKQPDFDLLISGGMVIDGTGAPRRRADVGVRGDTIVAVGDLAGRSALRTLRADGLIVAPGFIDLLGQSQRSVLVDPSLEGKVRQGVTTEVTGEGHSPGPITDAMAEEGTKNDPEVPVNWRTLGEYMKEVERRGTALNMAFYVGASNPRSMIIGPINRQPTQDEMRQMEEIIDQAMRDGAVGISTSLVYIPAVFSTTEEIIRLARVASKYGVGYWTHMRSESDKIDEALEEAFRIGREANIPVNIFHLKIGGRKNWGRMTQIVERIERERASGLDVQANVYPYIASSTGLTALAPDWALEGGYKAFLERLKDPVQRAKITDEIRNSSFYGRIGGASGALISRVPNPEFVQYQKKRLDEIAAMMNLDPMEALFRLYEASPYSPSALYFSMNEEDVKTALKQPWVSVGSDSGAVVGTMRDQGAHPRAYGTFPRVLGHYVRNEKLFTLEEGVRKVTSLAASRVGFSDRGVIREGMRADITVFSESEIRDVSTYEDPHHFSKGIIHVVVNGVPVLENETMTGALPGRVLRGPGYESAPARSALECAALRAAFRSAGRM